MLPYESRDGCLLLCVSYLPESHLCIQLSVSWCRAVSLQPLLPGSSFGSQLNRWWLQQERALTLERATGFSISLYGYQDVKNNP